MRRPIVYLKFACSFDGYLDDNSSERHVFSNAQDVEQVQQLRAEADAILVGAETVRKDGARLTLRDSSLIAKRVAEGKSAEPKRIIVTSSAKFSTDLPIFNCGSGERIIFASSLDKLAAEAASSLSGDGLARVIFTNGPKVELEYLLSALCELGVKSLLVEGGASILRQFIMLGLFDSLRVVISPTVLADAGRVKITDLSGCGLELLSHRSLGQLRVLEYRKGN